MGKKVITNKTISWANEGRMRQIHEIERPGFSHRERTLELKADEKEPLESRPETSTLTALRAGSSSRGETHMLAAFSQPALKGAGQNIPVDRATQRWEGRDGFAVWKGRMVSWGEA